jgi:hypothetical protein
MKPSPLCGAQLRGDDDVFRGKGNTCNAKATFRCISAFGSIVYRCTEHGAVFANAEPIIPTGENNQP